MRRSKSLFYTLTGALCLVMPCKADAESLRDAVSAALANHPAVEIANAQKQIAGEEESEQFSNLFPEISATATGGRVFGNNATSRGLTVSRGEAYSWLWEGSGSITQPIFNGFETYNRIDAAQAREGAAEFTMADTQQALALRAAQAFFNVMRAQEAYQKVNSYKDRIADYVGRIDAMVKGGAGDETESAQAKNIQAQLDNSVAEMEGQVKLAMADYAEATGSIPAGALTNTNEPEREMFGSAQDAIAFASVHHPLILAAQKTLDAEEEDVSAEFGSLMPRLDAETSYLKRDQKEEIGGEVIDGRAVMRMNWGFSTGGGQIARIKKAKAERSEAMARIAQTQRQIERDIRRAFAEYETAQKQKELNAKRAVVTKELFNTYEKQFEASKVRLLQLMQAENQLFTTELEEINAKYRVMIAEYTTLASSGRLLEALHIDGSDTPDKMKPAAGPVVTDAAPAPQAEAVVVETPPPAIEPVMVEKALGVDDKMTVTPAPVAAAPVVKPSPSSVYPAEDYIQADTYPAKGE